MWSAVKVEAPSEDKIKQMLANTKKSIEDRKKKLNIGLTGAGSLNAKAQQLAALQASIAQKLSQVTMPTGANKPVALIIDESGKTVDSTGRQIQLPAHLPTLRANQMALAKKLELTEENSQLRNRISVLQKELNALKAYISFSGPQNRKPPCYPSYPPVYPNTPKMI